MNIDGEERQMVARESPAYARVVLGEVLRRRRVDLGLNQADVASWIGQRQPKVAKLEGAELKRIKLVELDIILEGLGLLGEVAEELRGYARTPYAERGAYVDSSSRSQSWNGKARAETVARQYLSFHLESWDGLVQCLAYMLRQFELNGRSDIRAAAKRRQARQATVFEAERPAEFQFVVTEAALHRDMDAPAVLAEQLEHVLALAESHPFISIHVVPFGASVSTQVTDFTIMRFDSFVMNDLVLLEHEVGAVILDEEDDVRDYARVWTSLFGGALSTFDSLHKIRERIAQLRGPNEGEENDAHPVQPAGRGRVVPVQRLVQG